MNRSGFITLAALTLQGCAGTLHAGAPEVLTVERLYASSTCGSLNLPEVVWIADAKTWQEQYALIVSPYIEPPSLPKVDFPHEGVLLITMGQRTTGGYSLRLTGMPATVQGGVLIVPVEWREPPPGYALTQVMTSPCLLAKVPNGAFSQIHVVDQDGQLRLKGVR